MFGNIHDKTGTPGLIIAVIALVVALGGSAYAGMKIGSAQIKDGAITKQKLAKAVRAELAKASQPGPEGDQGPRGLPGATGATGPAGIPGPQGPTALLDPNRIYEITGSRTGSGIIHLACNPGDWAITAWEWGGSVTRVANSLPQNGRREWDIEVGLSDEQQQGHATVSCYDA